MDTTRTNSHVASYAELRITNDLLIVIADTLMRIESHLLQTPLRKIDKDEIAESRTKTITSAHPSLDIPTQD